ncbi:MAG TPA: hypothetical protein PLR06_08515 [Cyclobacteriaceae bacterium]|nr:hypothetical protein [Cyclobacteriaceae bacterium]
MDIVTKNKINILIQLAEADKHFATSERELIYKIASHHDFPHEIVAELIRQPEPIESLGALSMEQKLDFLLSSIELIFVDQRIFESEINLGKNIAIKLGFNKKVIDFLIENFEKKGLDELKRAVLDDYKLV